MIQPLLSIIIITHNQREEFRRCIESVLTQELPFEHEIIVSDDRSTDGTWELIKEYVTKYPSLIQGYQCNSDDCHPANNSHRSGWNRCNAYHHVRGKYIAHVDADDYFRPGADVYKRQVEMLERHPECSLCMANILRVDEEHNLAEGQPWHEKESFFNGQVIDKHDFVRRNIFILNQAFMMRRNPDVDPVALYGKRYVDSVITFHHLQFGNVVCVDSCDYVYVRHAGSIANNVAQTKDHIVLWCLGLYIPSLIPLWKHDYYLGDLQGIRSVVSLARSGYYLSESSLNSLEELKLYIYRVFGHKRKWHDKVRLFVTTLWIRLMQHARLKSRLATDILHFLLK